MFALPSCRPFLFRRRGWCLESLVLVGFLLPARATVAADAPSAPVHHPHHHAHHHPSGHHPMHPKGLSHKPAPQKPAAVVPVLPPHPATPPVAANVGTKTGLPLPRFASLRADDVNMRSGPGTQYPILWLYKRRDLPVQIQREFDLWRLVEDSDGVKGWVHTATLAGTRSFVVTARGNTGASAPELGDGAHGVGTLLRDDPRDDAEIIAILRPGVIGRIRACPARSAWCRVSTNNYSGWLLRSAIFGLLPDEAISPP